MLRLLFSRPKKKEKANTLTNIPRHLAIIMDGNGRWARSRMLPRIEGHRTGAKAVKMVVEESLKVGVQYLTVYAFSSENWGRPKDEVSGLMNLFARYLTEELDLFLKHNVRLRAIGDRDRLSDDVRNFLDAAEEKTKNNTAMQFIIAVSYGGRDELLNATKACAQKCVDGRLKVSDIDENIFRNHLYAPDVPDVDLLIRTSDEYRISNFLLWQLAYSEIVVTPVLWPDFSKEIFHNCLEEFGGRTRRFGLTQEQILAPLDTQEKTVSLT